MTFDDYVEEEDDDDDVDDDDNDDDTFRKYGHTSKPKRYLLHILSLDIICFKVD